MDTTSSMGPEQTNRDLREENQRLLAEKDALSRRIALLERQISFQPQTGLPTHFRLELELDELIEDSRNDPERRGFTVLIVQLGENYSVVRKTLKASVSEWILYQIGCRITGLLGENDQAFHTHENEFVLLLPGKKGEALTEFLRKLLPRLNEPQIFSGFNVTIGVSTGAAYWPEHGEERSALMHHADIAVGAAVEARKAFVLFRPRLLEKAVEKIELQNSIIRAIEASAFDRIGEQFFLCYQPKIFARSVEGRTIVVDRIEAETLIRWNHPVKGLLLPSTFVPLAEETGLILPLGKWLLYQCARKLAALAKSGRGDIGLSVNLSARQFRSEDMASTLETILKHTGVNPEYLTIELTETCLFEDPMATASTLQRFAALGVKLSVDDFGTGYSSLSHLHRFPLNEIKIDRLFVENLTSTRQDRIIVRSLVAIAKGLDLSLVAEGVEDPEALELLWQMGCKGFQGYLLAKPLSAADFVAFRDRIVANDMKIKF